MLGAWSVLHATDGVLGARFTASLGKCLAAHGRRVLLFDLSPEIPALDILLAVDDRVVYTLSDAEKLSPRDVLLTPEENLFFVPLGVGEVVDTSLISACIEDVKPDAVLFAASRSTLSFLEAMTDGMLLLTDASPVSLRAAGALASEDKFVGFVLSDFVPVREAIEKTPALSEIADVLGLPLFGILPYVSPWNTHTAHGKDFFLAVENMAGRLMGEQIPLLRGISVEGMRKSRFFTRISE